MVGRHFDLGGLIVDVDGNGIVLELGDHAKVREQLDRPGPGFKAAILLTDKGAALACDRHRLERLGVLADGEIVRIGGQVEVRDRCEPVLCVRDRGEQKRRQRCPIPYTCCNHLTTFGVNFWS